MAGSSVQPSSEPLVIEEQEGGVATLRLNRPGKLNALNVDLARALVHAFLRAAGDKAVRVIVLTGNGRAFCAGGDVEQIRNFRERRAAREFEELLVAGKEICLGIASTPKLVIASVNGPAVGGGMSLALACDLRIASDDASFAQAFTKLGLFPDYGSMYFLPRLVGLGRASELFYTAETVGAAEAMRIGIVSHLFPAAQLSQATKDLAERLAAGPPIAYRDIKHAMIGEKRREMEAILDEEIRLQTHCFQSEDCAEGLAAFFEKRNPEFNGH
jgi:enoyl-CoA hydratase/carnithine racemase